MKAGLDGGAHGHGEGRAVTATKAATLQCQCADAASTGADAHPQGPLPASRAIAFDDVPALLQAVNLRLRQVCSGCGAVGVETRHLDGWPAPLQADMLDCLSALEQLHSTLNLERGLRQQLQLDVVQAQASLAEVRAELLGTQAGERQARQLARRDSLTRLPNRGFFLEGLQKALLRAQALGQPLAVLFLDLDDFKPVNDVHGHQAGDQMLRIVAARLARSIRADDLVGRLGGDEFACLMDGLSDREQLSHLACKLIDAVAAPIHLSDLQLSVRPSIGLAIFPTDGQHADELLRRADAAMYRAKRDRVGHAFFDTVIDA